MEGDEEKFRGEGSKMGQGKGWISNFFLCPFSIYPWPGVIKQTAISVGRGLLGWCRGGKGLAGEGLMR